MSGSNAVFFLILEVRFNTVLNTSSESQWLSFNTHYVAGTVLNKQLEHSNEPESGISRVSMSRPLALETNRLRRGRSRSRLFRLGSFLEGVGRQGPAELKHSGSGRGRPAGASLGVQKSPGTREAAPGSEGIPGSDTNSGREEFVDVQRETEAATEEFWTNSCSAGWAHRFHRASPPWGGRTLSLPTELPHHRQTHCVLEPVRRTRG